MNTKLVKATIVLAAWGIYNSAAWSYWVEKTMQAGPFQFWRVAALVLLVGVVLWEDQA